MSRRTFRLDAFHPNETVTTLLIEERYKKIGVFPGFRAARAAKIARWIGCSLHELGRMAGMELAEVDKAVKEDRFPPSASLQFACIESWFYIKFRGGGRSRQKRDTRPVAAVDILLKSYGSSSNSQKTRDNPGAPSPDLRATGDEGSGSKCPGE